MEVARTVELLKLTEHEDHRKWQNIDGSVQVQTKLLYRTGWS